MSNVSVFEHPEFGQVRHVKMDGSQWFVLSDVAEVLGYKRTSDAKVHLRDSQFSTANRRTGAELGFNSGSMPGLITEGGLYRLMLRSKTQHAERFQVWVEDVVLPQIRQDGIYIQDSMPEALRVRADEKFSYSKLKDFVMYASDYDPESEETRKAFARMQNDLYRKFVGMDASDIKAVRPVNMELLGKTRKDGKPYAADAKVAKNYLATEELSDINNAALAALGMLGLRMRSFKNGYTMQDVRMSLLKVLDSI